MLTILDQILAVGGVAILLIWVVRARHGRPAPGSGLPEGIREDAVLLAMLGYMAGVMVLSGLMEAKVGTSDPVLTALVVNNGAQLCGIAACLFIIARRVPGGIGSFVMGGSEAGRSLASFDLKTISAFSVIAIGVCPPIRDLTARIILIVAPDFSFEPHPTLRALNDTALPAVRAVALWIGAALIAPVAEEFFFRGFLLTYLSSALQDKRTAILLSSAAFAAVHFSMPYALLALFFLGILLASAYCWTEKLYVPVAIHVAFNLKTLVWEALQRNPA